MPKPPWALWALDREWGPSWRVQGSGHTVPKRLGGKGYDSLLLWGRGGEVEAIVHGFGCREYTI